jgi:hypothetical protein
MEQCSWDGNNTGLDIQQMRKKFSNSTTKLVIRKNVLEILFF